MYIYNVFSIFCTVVSLCLDKKAAFIMIMFVPFSSTYDLNLFPKSDEADFFFNYF